MEIDELTDESEGELEALPDWLTTMAEESEPSLPETDDAYPDEALPDWLRGAIDDRSADERPAIADEEPVAAAHDEVVTDDEAPGAPPRTMRNLGSSPNPSCPDWLFESQTEATRAA